MRHGRSRLFFAYQFFKIIETGCKRIAGLKIGIQRSLIFLTYTSSNALPGEERIAFEDVAKKKHFSFAVLIKGLCRGIMG